MAENRERLFDQFPPVTYDEWRAKVEADPQKAPTSTRSWYGAPTRASTYSPSTAPKTSPTSKQPIRLPGQFPYVRGTRTDNDWLTRQDIVAETAEEANASALDVLTKGVTSLGFKVHDAAEVPVLLKGIDRARLR